MKTTTIPNLVHRASVSRHQKNYADKIGNAVAALEAADMKLGLVLDDFDDEARSHCDRGQIRGDRLAIRLLAGMLLTGEMPGVLFLGGMTCTGEVPGLPRCVFKAIVGHANTKASNTRHLEGAIIALELAHDALESALEMTRQLDGDEIDAAYEIPYAAWSIVKDIASRLGCAAIPFDVDGALQKIVATKPTLAMAA